MERHRTKRKYGQWTCGTMLEVVIVVCVCVCMWCVHLHVCVHMCTCIMCVFYHLQGFFGFGCYFLFFFIIIFFETVSHSS